MIFFFKKKKIHDKRIDERRSRVERDTEKKTKENLFAFIHSLLDDSVTQKKIVNLFASSLLSICFRK